MRRTFLKALRDERGYVAVLALIAMPLLLGFSLLVIDVARGNNLHTDLQNAVDALALAGARELDGGADSIVRAEAAMTDLLNNQARFSDGGAVIIERADVEVRYYETIPADDDTPMDPDAAITDPLLANFVWVRSNTRQMTSLFPIPVGFNKDTVNFQAEAVATYDVSACDITPMFLCNPFEPKTVQQAFADGDFHGTLISARVPQTQGDPAGPGNFGFLDVAGANGASALKAQFAGFGAPLCIDDAEEVATQPGFINSVGAAVNTRFDMKEPGIGNITIGPPSRNVRKGIETSKPNSKPDQCNLQPILSINPLIDKTMSFPDDLGIRVNGNAGSIVGDGNWNCDQYWNVNYGVSTGCPADIVSSTPGREPSRYDVYQYELSGQYQTISPGGETGKALCYMKDNAQAEPTLDPDRRIIFAALVDCQAAGAINGSKTLDVEAFAKVFLTRPVRSNQNTPNRLNTSQQGQISYRLDTIDIEVVDITGPNGRGTLEQFIREESFLVR